MSETEMRRPGNGRAAAAHSNSGKMRVGGAGLAGPGRGA